MGSLGLGIWGDVLNLDFGGVGFFFWGGVGCESGVGVFWGVKSGIWASFLGRE